VKTLEVALAGVVRPDILGGGGSGRGLELMFHVACGSLWILPAGFEGLFCPSPSLRGVAGSEVGRRPTSLSSVRLSV